jgi:hypothetical protein
MVAAAERDTLASIRSGWYSYSSVAGRQPAAVARPRYDAASPAVSPDSSGDP